MTDVKTLRERVRMNIDKGPVIDASGVDYDRVLDVLKLALATELVCVLRYKNHCFSADGLNAQSAADEFLEHASEAQDHADQIAARIQQLGGEPDFNPETLTCRNRLEHDSYKEFDAMIREDLVAERVAIGTYEQMIAWLGDGDPTSRRLVESILAVEQEHAEDMLDLLAGIG